LWEEVLRKLCDILGPEETFSDIHNTRTKLQEKKLTKWLGFTTSLFLLGIKRCASLAGFHFCCARPPSSLPKAKKCSPLLHVIIMAAARHGPFVGVLP